MRYPRRRRRPKKAAAEPESDSDDDSDEEMHRWRKKLNAKPHATWSNAPIWGISTACTRLTEGHVPGLENHRINRKLSQLTNHNRARSFELAIDHLKGQKP